MEETINKPGMSTGMVVGIAVIVAIVFGGGAYAYVNNKAEKEKKDLNAQITELQSQVSSATTATTTTPSSSTSTTAATDWKTYTNDKYGFTLTFTDKWQGYKIKGESDNISAEASYRVFVPTSNKTFSSAMPGYANPFIINIYKKATYDSLKANTNANDPFELSYGTKLTDNGTYVATVSYWQDSPDDLRASGLDKEVTSVAQSFQFTK